MTIEEFKTTRFSAGQEVFYKNNSYELATVNFQEFLIGFYTVRGDDDSLTWVRCENCYITQRYRVIKISNGNWKLEWADGKSSMHSTEQGAMNMALGISNN